MNRKEKKMNKRTALITGITGQDGSYLAEFLVEKGHEATKKSIKRFPPEIKNQIG